MTLGCWKLLLVEDNAALREAIASQFALHQEFQIVQAGTASQGFAAITDDPPDMIILDVDLPDMDGREMCRLIRKRKLSTPILMLTAQNTDADTILGLDAGANDYVTKPFKFPILLARVRAHIRVYENGDDVTFRFGPFEYQPGAKLLVDDQQRKIRLTERENDLLRILYRSRGKLVRREEFLEEIWGEAGEVNAHAVESTMYRLRQKVEPHPSNARYIISEAGGYVLRI